jgi:hypothetical protein
VQERSGEGEFRVQLNLIESIEKRRPRTYRLRAFVRRQSFVKMSAATTVGRNPDEGQRERADNWLYLDVREAG